MKNRHKKYTHIFMSIAIACASIFGCSRSVHAADPCYFMVEDVCFASLSAAYSAVPDGGTITLEENLGINSLLVSNKSLILDLNGHYFTGTSNNYTIAVLYDSIVTIKDSANGGILTNTGEGYPVALADGGTLILESGTITTKPNDETNSAIYIYSSEPEKGAHAWIKGGTVVGNTFAIYVGNNGELVMDDGVVGCYDLCILNSGSIADGSHITINGGAIKQLGNDGSAIYHPGPGNLTINGGEIFGSAGVEMRAGSLTVTGGTISATPNRFNVRPNGSGNTVSEGATIVISQHTTQKPISVNISGGTFSGFYGFYQGNVQSNPADAIEKISANITGGTFTTGSSSGAAVYSENLHEFVSGGDFYMPSGQVETFIKSYMDDTMTVVQDSTTGAIAVRDIIHSEGLPDDRKLVMAHDDFSNISDEKMETILDKLEAAFDSLPSELQLVQEEIIELMDLEGVGLPQLDAEIRLSVPIGEEYSTPEAGYTRKWFVYNEYRDPSTGEYTYKVLDAAYDAESGTLSFMTNTFSQFYVGYADVLIPSVPDTSAIITPNKAIALTALAIVSGAAFYFKKLRHRKMTF